MDGEVGTDENVDEVVSHVVIFWEHLYHNLWILGNNHYCIIPDPVRGMRTVHETDDGVGYTAKSEEGGHDNSSADEIGMMKWDTVVDGGDDLVGQMDAPLLVGKHDETEMTLKRYHMAKMEKENDDYHMMTLNCAVLLESADVDYFPNLLFAQVILSGQTCPSNETV